MTESIEAIRKFKLDINESVLLESFRCVYHGGGVPTLGRIYIFNTHVCFRSKVDLNKLFGSSKFKIETKDIIYSDIASKVGNKLSIYLNTGKEFEFSGLGEGLEHAHKLITSIAESL